jgi:non-ribosomal peptide synthetase component F
MTVEVRPAVRLAPLSPAQERIWFSDAAAPGNATYNVPLLCRTSEQIDPIALTEALRALTRRHEILRTCYRLERGRPVQVVLDEDAGADLVDVLPVDLTGASAERARAEVMAYATEPFDLTTGPMLRAVVWNGRPGGSVVLLLMHHIAIDGWSLAPLFEDLTAAYRAAQAGGPAQLPELTTQYADFAMRERQEVDSDAARARAVRRAAELAGIPGGLTLAGCRGTPAAPDGSRPGAQRTFVLPDGTGEAVAGLARSLRVTPFVLLLAVTEVLVRHWSGRPEFLLGVMTANRQDVTVERLVGFFVNTVALRCRVAPHESLRQLCGSVKAEAYASLACQRIPFDHLTAEVARCRGGGREPLVDVGFVLQNMTAPGPDAESLWGCPVVLGTGTAKFDLLLMVDEGEEGFVLTIEHDTDRYPAEVVAELGAGFLSLLAAVLADPDAPVGGLPGGPRGFAVAETPAVPGPTRPLESVVDGSAAAPDGAELAQAAELFTAALASSRGLSPGQLDGGDDFFVLGGHSLLAVTMLAEAQRRYGFALPPREFLARPTVAGLARLLRQARAQGSRPPAVATRPMAADDPVVPASPVQQRLWTIDRIPALRPAYLLPSVVEYAGPVDRAMLAQAVDLVLARHPALRSRFALDRRRRQVCYRTDGPPATAERIDASSWSPDELRGHLASVCWQGFDLGVDAPARAHILAHGPHRTLLVLVVHHIVVDGWSRRVLTRELAQAYAALADGHGPAPAPAAGPLPAPAPEPDESVDEVVRRLRGAPTDIALPHDRPRAQVQGTRGAFASSCLGPELTARVRRVALPSGCSTFMTTAALLAVVLARRGNQRDFLFAFPWAGRDDPRTADAVGMFVNTLVLRVDLTGRPRWRDLLAAVRDHSTFCFRHADVAFDALAARLHPDRDLSRPPLTTVFLSAQEAMDTPAPLSEAIAARYLDLEPLHIKYELELVATELDDDVELTLSYVVDLFDEATAVGLLDELRAAADDLATDPDSHPL